MARRSSPASSHMTTMLLAVGVQVQMRQTSQNVSATR
eukprot:CAMPEP_0181236074 /NCGR_PEP_ID=MMETSP1096-20121128/37959_1 /TAXON_ID=156174 ORGANISM="Chrysochromulina ericina, Strain CCMP281" /NCGR_SAMPLE_ID=MMETSP1096 /ASSEMBLY_ACC=CAM_ASM_000453 /LENGTH=36 /DNA_ID= /DNA_START= /DNA_END= /DNA_ORIENTATION=